MAIIYADEFFDKFNTEERREHFRNAVVLASDKIDAINEAEKLLQYNIAYCMKKYGTKNIKVNELTYKDFDFKNKIGVSISVSWGKDPNASAILYMAECYEKVILELKRDLNRRWFRNFIESLTELINSFINRRAVNNYL